MAVSLWESVGLVLNLKVGTGGKKIWVGQRWVSAWSPDCPRPEQQGHPRAQLKS